MTRRTNAPNLTSADRSLLRLAGPGRAPITAALWPSAPGIAADLARDPASIRRVPAAWVEHVLALCPKDVAEAAVATDKRDCARRALAVLHSPTPPVPKGPRPGTMAHSRKFAASMKQALREWNNHAIPVDLCGDLSPEAEAYVDEAHDLWTMPGDPAQEFPLYTKHQSLVNRAAPSWVLAEVLGRVPEWSAAEVTAFNSLASNKWRTPQPLLRLVASATPRLTKSGLAVTRLGGQAERAAVWDPLQAAFLSTAGAGGFPEPMQVGYGSITASGLLALAVASANFGDVPELDEWILSCTRLTSGAHWHTRISDVRWLTARVLRDLPAGSPLRSAVLQFAGGEALDHFSVHATDEELGEWVRSFSASCFEDQSSMHWRLTSVLRIGHRSRLVQKLVLDMHGLAPMLRSGALKDAGISALLDALNAELGGCDDLVWQLALEWSDAGSVTLREVCEAARRTAAEVGVAPAA